MVQNRWMRSLAALAAAGVAVVALAASGETNTATKVGGDGSPTTSAGAATPPSTFKVGDVVQLGDWSVVVNAVTDPWTSTSQFDTPKGRYVSADITVQNLGTKPSTVSSIMCFELRDGTGRSFNQALVLGSTGKAPDGEVDAGGQLRGTMVFDVPTDATGLVLRFKCDLLSSGSASIALG